MFHRHYNRIVEWTLVILCLAITLLSTFLLRDATRPNQLIIAMAPILIIAGAAVFGLIYTHLHWIAVLIPIISTVFHEGIRTGSETKLTVTFILLNVWALLWLFKMLVVQRKFTLLPAAINWTALFFICLATLSFIWSSLFVDHQVGFLYNNKLLPRLMTFDVMIISPLASLLFANHLRSERSFKWIAWWFVAVGSVFWIRYFIPWSSANVINTDGQFSAFVCAFALGQLFCNRRLRWYMRLALVGIIGIWMYVQIQLGMSWLSGWLPVVLAIGTVSFLYSRKVTLLLVLAAAFYVVAISDVFEANLERENEESGVTRTAAWEQALGIAKDHLLLGTGPAGYHYYLTAYGAYDSGIAQLSHNNFVDVIAQNGVGGFIAYISFWIGAGIMTWKLLWVPVQDGFLRGVKISLLACYPVTLLSMMLGDWVIPFPYTQTLAGIDYTIWHWMMAGMTVALYHFLSNRNKALLPGKQ